MKAAIICKGPSVKDTWHPEMVHDYRYTISINEAIHLQSFDTLPNCLICGDIEILRKIRIFPKSHMVVYPIEDVFVMCDVLDLIVSPWQVVKRKQEFVKSDDCFCSTHLALCLLAAEFPTFSHLLTDIDIYGNDMGGNGYFFEGNGILPDDYDWNHRWSVEKKATLQLIKSIENKTKIKVNNIQP